MFVMLYYICLGGAEIYTLNMAYNRDRCIGSWRHEHYHKSLCHPCDVHMLMLTVQFFAGMYIMVTHPSYAISGLAAALLVRSILGGVLPIFVSDLYH
jgi:hypothetical protein